MIAEYLQFEENSDNNDDIELVRLIYTLQTAKEALQVLIEFTENRDNLKTEYLRSIERYKQELERLEHDSRVQSTLDSWLT